MMQPVDAATDADLASAADDLSPRTRLVLFHQTATSTETALTLPASEFTLARLRELGCTTANLRAAELSVAQLRRFGIATAAELRSAGFDALDLRNASFAADCIAAFGASGTVAAFLHTPSDAVALAGTHAASVLGVGCEALLRACAGEPAVARVVLEQLAPGALQSVALDVLLDSGLQLPALAELGYPFTAIVDHFRPSPQQLALLGAKPLGARRA